MGYSNLKSATVSRYFEDKDVKGETNEYLSYIMSKIKNSSMRNYKKDSELAVQMEIFLNDLKQIANPNITLGDVLTKKNEDEYIKLLLSLTKGLEGLFTKVHNKTDVKDKPFDDIVENEINIIMKRLFNSEKDYYAGEKSANVKNLSKIIDSIAKDFQNTITDNDTLSELSKVTKRSELFSLPEARSQKADIYTTKITISQNILSERERLLSLFSGHSFSIKNYNNDNKYGTRVTLGKTDPLKAFIGVLTSLREPQSLAVKAFYAASAAYQRDANPELAANIFAIRYYYELTGAGLRIDGKEIDKVDFLIVNNPSGRIKVRSTKELVYNLLNNNQSYLQKYNPFREVHAYI